MIDHITILNLELNFSYMIGTLEKGENRKIDIRKFVKDFEENTYAYPHMKQLLNEAFFNKGKLSRCWSIYWDDMTGLRYLCFLKW